MGPIIIRKLIWIIITVALLNFIAFSYAFISLQTQKAQNPFGSNAETGSPAILPLYSTYISDLASGDLGKMPGSLGTVSEVLANAISASLGLILIVFLISTSLGLLIGSLSVRSDPAGLRGWLLPGTAIGLALPGFFIATIFISVVVYYLISQGPESLPPIPISGFGWDVHLFLPVTALIIRPIAQIAQTTAVLLSGELRKQYVVSARSLGSNWTRIRRRDAMKNVIAPISAVIGASFRSLIAELILVEYIFSWPGLGRLLTNALIPPLNASPQGLGAGNLFFLHPPLLAALVPIFAFLFLIADLMASTAAQIVDPRLRNPETEELSYDLQ